VSADTKPTETASTVEAFASSVRRVAERERRRLMRRIEAVRTDMARAEEATANATSARLFVAVAAHAKRGTTSLTAVDWSTGEPVPRTLDVDPAKLPRAQLDALFERARRLSRGRCVAEARVADAQEKLGRLEVLTRAVENATSEDDITALVAAARREDPSLLPATAGVPTKRRLDASRVPYRTFVTSSGARILVGKCAKDNDELTASVARPRDLWLHVKDVSGSHVVVPLAKSAQVAEVTLVDAAHLAAHFSDARGEPVVDVTYVPRRYVRKPRRSPPGAVVTMREKVIALRVEPDRLAALLAREESR
jgi:predicted ribosome quality control (RQC) complex YloA/Tae2 family protein